MEGRQLEGRQLVDDMKAELVAFMGDDVETALHNIRRYVETFPHAMGYNVYAYGNMRVNYSDLRIFYRDNGVDTSAWNDDALQAHYERLIEIAVAEMQKEGTL